MIKCFSVMAYSLVSGVCIFSNAQAQDSGFGYVWKGGETPLGNIIHPDGRNNIEKVANPMAECSFPYNAYSFDVYGLCQVRYGTCENIAGKQGFNKNQLFYCSESDRFRGRGGDYSRWNIFGAIARRANLADSNFSFANLHESNFFGSNLDFANFHGANLWNVDFTQVSAIGASFSSSNFYVRAGTFNANKGGYNHVSPLGLVLRNGINLQWAYFGGANVNAVLANANLSYANFHSAKGWLQIAGSVPKFLIGITLIRADMDITLIGSSPSYLAGDESNLRLTMLGASLSQSSLRNSTLSFKIGGPFDNSQTILSKIDFSNSSVNFDYYTKPERKNFFAGGRAPCNSIRCEDSSIRDSNFKNAIITGRFINTTFERNDFTGAKISAIFCGTNALGLKPNLLALLEAESLQGSSFDKDWINYGFFNSGDIDKIKRLGGRRMTESEQRTYCGY